MTPRFCYLCKQVEGPGPRELRPYGAGGRLVCAGCVMGEPSKPPDPEAAAEAKQRFAAAVDAASAEVRQRPGTKVILTKDGPKVVKG